ncbi:MAG: isoaspartyl peptidase/L-asparaginase [Candidatus Odinarchaeota archaeon]
MTLELAVIVHGGAWNIPDDAVKDHLNGVSEACKLAHSILAEGGASIDAAESCVALMEDDPTFDAGRGSFCNTIGEVEMDAIIATDDLRIGSVCAVQNIRNPVKLARLVLDKTKHVMIAGKGALLFAREQGIPGCRPEDLLVGRELERYYAIKKMKHFEPKDAFRSSPGKSNGLGTVGCVCLDQSGGLAVAVSTGGTPHKLPGRVGDSPLWGSGAYVESTGGAAATGYGEDLIRIIATRQAVDYLRVGLTAQQAADWTVEDLGKKAAGLGGLIVLNRDGLGLAFNTPRMAFAYQVDGGKLVAGIDPSDLQQLDKL